MACATLGFSTLTLTLNRFQSNFCCWPVGRQLDDVLIRCLQMASDIFAKIGDIKGESLDDKHKDEIEVLSWSWGVSNAGEMRGGSGGGEGKASFHDLSFTH